MIAKAMTGLFNTAASYSWLLPTLPDACFAPLEAGGTLLDDLRSYVCVTLSLQLYNAYHTAWYLRDTFKQDRYFPGCFGTLAMVLPQALKVISDMARLSTRPALLLFLVNIPKSGP